MDRSNATQREQAEETVESGQAPRLIEAATMYVLAGAVRLLRGEVSAKVLMFMVLASIGLSLAIYAAATNTLGLTPASLPVLLVFTVWLFGTYLALRSFFRSAGRGWQAPIPAAHEKPAVVPLTEVAPVQPRDPERGPSAMERARNLVPWVLTLLAAIPLAILSFLVGALVADPLEAVGVPNSVTFPLGLSAMGATFVAGTIIVFRRLWTRSPAARRRMAAAEARRLRLLEIDAHLAPPEGPASPVARV